MTETRVFHCESEACKETPDFESVAALKEHLATVHGRTGELKGERTFFMHGRGDGYSIYVYLWKFGEEPTRLPVSETVTLHKEKK